MFEKLDNFVNQYIKTAGKGSAIIGETVANFYDTVINISLAILSLLVIVIGFPLWLLGKLSAQHSVQPTDCTCPRFENGSKVFPMRECAGCRQSVSR